MGYTASKVIKIAQEEVGYLEKETNSALDSKTANAGDNNKIRFQWLDRLPTLKLEKYS